MIAPTPTLRTASRRPVPPSPRDATMETISRGLQIIAQLRPQILAFNFAELGDIELPPETSSSVDQASLKSAAPLYLASELESAGLYAAIDLLAGVFAGGSLTIPRGATADRLARFWRGRRDRLSIDERQAYFARLFGAQATPLAAEGGSNADFEMLMVDLTEALLQYVEHPLLASRPGPREEASVRIAARQLAANLIPRSGGMTPFAAEDLLATAKEALEIMRTPDVQTSFAAHSVWDVVRNILRRYGQRSNHITDHLSRGKAGLLVLTWLAETSTRLSDFSNRVLDPGDPVIAAASGWLQASLSLATARPTASALTVEGAAEAEESGEEEVVIHTESIDRRDKPLLSGLPLGAQGEELIRFTVPEGYRFSRWHVTTIDSTPGATYEVKLAPERGAEGAQTLRLAWSYPPFGHIGLRLEVFGSPTGAPGVAKVTYETAGWLDECRDQLQQGVPIGLAVRGSPADALHAALQEAAAKQSQGQARAFVAGVDDAVIIAIVAAVVLVVVASMGFFVLYSILQTAMAKGYEVNDTRFKVGGGQGPTAVDSELVFNLIPQASG